MTTLNTGYIADEIADAIVGEVHVHMEDEMLIVEIATPYFCYRYDCSEPSALSLGGYASTEDLIIDSVEYDYRDHLLSMYFKDGAVLPWK